MNWWDDIGWAIERPQQAIFQGAKAGSENFNRNDLALWSAGVPSYYSVPIAAALSVPSAVIGAAKGLIGQAENVHGKDVTQGLTGTWWDDAIGTGLGFMADPTVAAGGWASKPLGTIARTARNIWGLEKYAPIQAEALNSFGRIGKYLQDIPVAPRNPMEPVVMRSSNPFTIKEILSPESAAKMQQVADKLGGSYYPSQRIIATNPAKPENLAHEAVHWARRFIPSDVQNSTAQGLERIAQLNPKLVEILRQYPSYSRLNMASLGEELAARALARGKELPNKLRDLQNKAKSFLQPDMYEDAARIPLEILSLIPHFGGTWE